MNKVAVISGGTKGIGRAIVHAFAMHGFDIITCSRNASELSNLKSEVESAFPAIEVLTRKSDLSLRDEVHDFVSFIISNKSQVEVLVNNTGVFLPGAISSEPEGRLETMINTNLYSAYYLTRGLLPQMMHHMFRCQYRGLSQRWFVFDLQICHAWNDQSASGRDEISWYPRHSCVARRHTYAELGRSRFAGIAVHEAGRCCRRGNRRLPFIKKFCG